MIFQWRLLWILPALFLCGGIAFAAGTAKEQRAFSAAGSAFQDGMWSRAEAELDQFKKDFPKSTNAPQALLMQAEAEFNQGEFTNAIALLADAGNMAKSGNLADQYFYWIGEAQFQNTNYQDAAETWIALEQKFSESPLRLRAVVSAAAALVEQGGWQRTVALLEETNGVFQRTVQMDSGNELVSRGRLLLAQAKFALQDFAGEFAVLTSLNPQTLKPDLGWQCAYLIYQNRNAAGDFAAALVAATNILQSARLENNGGLYSESVALHADALEKSGLTNEAIAAYSENLTNNAPVERQRQAVLKIAALSVAQDQFPAATNALETFLAQFPDSPAADIALLTLGELHLKNYTAQPQVATNDLQQAQARFDQFISTFTNSPLIGKAYLDRGWCKWLPEKNPGSSGDFQMAANSLPFSEDLAVAKFKLGDALFAQGDFAGARTNYESVVDDFTNFPAVGESLGAQALYQLSRVCIKLNDLDGARSSLARILTIYPTSDLAENGILLAGEGMTDLNYPTNALKLFQQFKDKFPNSDLLPEDELAMARAYEQERDWPSAIGVYDGWVEHFGTNSLLLPQVEYARAWANFQAGNETNAFQLFTNFIAQFPQNPLAPVAQWWVGDHFYRAGEFVDAERNYEYVFQNWPTNDLAYPAKMMAGRAAMGRGSYQDAIGYFTSLTADTNCPPDYDAQALFAYGGALTLMESSDTNKPLSNFDLAAAVFKQISQKYPSSEQAALAQGEIGDCYLELTNFVAATNAYAQVVNSTNASVSARSQAQVGIGIATEKMAALTTITNQAALFNQALGNYSDVLYENNLRDGEQPDPFWRKKAGLQAAALAEALANYEVATNVYLYLEDLFPQAKDSLDKKIAALQAHLSPGKN
jgi:TolA-binding protein